MRASVLSLFVAILAPLAFAAPAERATTVITPHGERPADSVHQVPQGM